MKKNLIFCSIIAGLFVGLLCFSCGNAAPTDGKSPEKKQTFGPNESMGGSVMDAKIEQGVLDMDAYNEYLRIGDLALKEGRVEEALMNYRTAATSNDSEEIRTKITATIDQLYQSYIDKGMAYFNEKNYLYAKKEFETARLYKNITAVNELIEKCKAEL